MASKPSPLAAALRNSGANVAAAPAPEPVAEPVKKSAASTPKAVQPARKPPSAVAPSRVSTKAITVHFPEAVRRQLKMLAAEQGRAMEDLVAEGLNLVFVKYRKPEIAPRKNGEAS